MILTVKIHPSTARLSEYESLIHSIDKSIKIHQKGDIRDFLDDADVYISSEISTGEFFAVIARKPIIICNFFNNKNSNLLVENNVAKLCKHPENLLSIIKETYPNPKSEITRQKFIQKYLYKEDGRSSERISNSLIKLYGETKPNHSF